MENIKELLTHREVYTVKKGTSIRDVVYYMSEKRVGLVPVMDEGKLVGVFSERDLVQRVIAKNINLEDTKVEDVMTSKLIIAKIDESNESVLTKMKEANTRHILVIEGDKLAGVVSMRDLLELHLTDYKTTVEVLNNYIYSK
jgi:CBS domain-containing protein